MLRIAEFYKPPPNYDDKGVLVLITPLPIHDDKGVVVLITPSPIDDDKMVVLMTQMHYDKGYNSNQSV